jgi:hypothetical protein
MSPQRRSTNPNVVPILSAGADKGHLYLAMRCIDVKNLNEALADRESLSLKAS